jgi:hypothetical protein
MSGTNNYPSLITSEHQKPNFIAVITALTQGSVDNQAILSTLAAYFDLDAAVGSQLDAVGLWVGISRNLTIPLTNVYFAFDTAGVGFDQGTWWSPFDPVTQLDVLPDDAYRILLRARIAANQWDGTVPTAYTIWNTLFASTGTSVLIQDNQNMTMEFALLGPLPNAVTLALLENGYLNLKPVGVAIDDYWTPSVANTPYFGFDVESSAISGFDVGAWGTLTPATNPI